jgi:ABC-type antimicrobial peptide transport system permease subunit
LLQKLRRRCRPTTFLLIIGFAISLTAVLIGISSVNAVISAISEMGSEAPIYSTMQNTGLSLALAVYLFSIVNCFAVTNYWMAARRREMAIRKAFGWSNGQLMGLTVREMGGLLAVSLGISAGVLTVLEKGSRIFSWELTPFFLLGTFALLLLTLFLAVLVPIIRIFKIQPAEVIS